MKLDSKARKIFNSLPQKIKNYFLEIDEDCANYGITFKVSGGKGINFGGGRCGGYFCSDTKVLAVSINRKIPNMLGLLIHEASHFDQWKDLDSVWYKPMMYASGERFFNWLSGSVELSHPERDAKRIIELELDCEKRALRKIKRRWSDVINPEQYAQSANAYMFSYLYMAQSRKWIGDFISINKYCNKFPEKMLPKYDDIPEKYLKLFKQHENKKAPSS